MLINCVVYQEGKKLCDIPVAQISDYLQKPGCFVWVALRDADEAELNLMQEEFNLHELAVEDARHGHQRPKVEEYGDSVFVVMHLLEKTGTEFAVGEVHIFAGPNYVLSVRNRSTLSLLGVRGRCEREPELLSQGAGFVLYALMDAVVDSYFPVLDALETELDEAESQIFHARTARNSIQRLYELKERVTQLRHAVSPLVEATTKLHTSRAPRLCASAEHYFRDVHDHLARIESAVENLREKTAIAMQVNLAFVTIEESEITKKLAGWAGIFAAATAFAGVWGMNFKYMPELQWEYGYPAALGFISIICYLLYRRFRRAGWL
ncbi:MAG: magnesium/cobalt transporter CorA [Spirochaetota bacterium]